MSQNPEEKPKSFRRRLYDEFDPLAQTEGLSIVNRVLVLLILVGVATVIIETETSIYQPHKLIFQSVDLFLAILFTCEFAARVWVAGENPQYEGIFGRLKYMCSITSLIDLFSIAPFYIPIMSNDLFLLRITRLLRIFALGRFGRYSRALQEFGMVLHNRREELAVSVIVVSVVILISSSVMYIAEGRAQPEAFGSIPRALWWGVETLTTVGYGDVYPKTLIGKICCAVTAIAGIGLIAIPTGVLSAAFSEVFVGSKRSEKSDSDSTDNNN